MFANFISLDNFIEYVLNTVDVQSAASAKTTHLILLFMRTNCSVKLDSCYHIQIEFFIQWADVYTKMAHHTISSVTEESVGLIVAAR